jgi:PHD/YefM family antitoxin component YafN of YafNO toxin-antitoxin module
MRERQVLKLTSKVKAWLKKMTINAKTFTGNFYNLIDNVATFGEKMNFWTPNGTAVLMSEDEYQGLINALELYSTPGMYQKIVDGLNTPLSECIPENEVDW